MGINFGKMDVTIEVKVGEKGLKPVLKALKTAVTTYLKNEHR